MNFLVSLAAFGMLSAMCCAHAADQSLYPIALTEISGKPTTLKAYEGKAILIVNVASECGFTPQYAPLEAIYQKYKAQGFVVLGFPSNDFGGQEPGTAQQIKLFCSSTYKVTFPLFEKTGVKSGASQHPLYSALTGKESAFPGEVKWNFGKFLISRDGKLVARFDSEDEPDSEKVTKAIQACLAAK